MKLVTFDRAGRSSTGAVIGERLIDLGAAGLPDSMKALIAAWPTMADKVRALIAAGKTDLDLKAVHLKAPVPDPQKILAIGLNYADHIEETGRQKPDRQVWFAKLPNAVNGPFDPIQIPKASSMIDYEAELVVVIGKRCRHVSREEAPGAIFGFTAGNDVSVRDWQNHTPQWILGKSFDSHAPSGPWIVTADEIGDPQTLAISCRVNGEVRQNSNTKHLIFSVADQIAHLSQAMTLLPGDMIYTGTPGGVGMAMKPPSFLKAGDVVRVEIEKIGALEATMAPEE
ncbi:MAG: fumarylacetoacetate hydrolase family protein [Rhizomicrobium sp.]|jgi:2-keto-4-pentenoate hydratase/2-oxohepta-3-ene-1,7-dioic acid hydratase in catechol pathway